MSVSERPTNYQEELPASPAQQSIPGSVVSGTSGEASLTYTTGLKPNDRSEIGEITPRPRALGDQSRLTRRGGSADITGIRAMVRPAGADGETGNKRAGTTERPATSDTDTVPVKREVGTEGVPERVTRVMQQVLEAKDNDRIYEKAPETISLGESDNQVSVIKDISVFGLTESSDMGAVATVEEFIGHSMAEKPAFVVDTVDNRRAFEQAASQGTEFTGIEDRDPKATRNAHYDFEHNMAFFAEATYPNAVIRRHEATHAVVADINPEIMQNISQLDQVLTTWVATDFFPRDFDIEKGVVAEAINEGLAVFVSEESVPSESEDTAHDDFELSLFALETFVEASLLMVNMPSQRETRQEEKKELDQLKSHAVYHAGYGFIQKAMEYVTSRGLPKDEQQHLLQLVIQNPPQTLNELHDPSAYMDIVSQVYGREKTKDQSQLHDKTSQVAMPQKEDIFVKDWEEDTGMLQDVMTSLRKIAPLIWQRIDKDIQMRKKWYRLLIELYEKEALFGVRDYFGPIIHRAEYELAGTEERIVYEVLGGVMDADTVTGNLWLDVFTAMVKQVDSSRKTQIYALLQKQKNREVQVAAQDRIDNVLALLEQSDPKISQKINAPAYTVQIEIPDTIELTQDSFGILFV